MYKIISILAFLFFLSQINLFADNINEDFYIEDEEYVDDIPFNTSDIIGLDLDTNSGSKAPEQTFESKLIIVKDLMNVNFELEDEEYIDDIPFSTVKVLQNQPLYMSTAMNNAMKVEFTLAEEDYIDDIPFDTSELINETRP